MSQNRPIITLIFLVLIVVAGLAGLTWANYRISVQSPGGNDFLARWVGARMWLLEGISPYDERVSMETQEMIYGRPADPTIDEDLGHFVYPLPSMIFFAPFGLFEYTLARALWMTFLELVLGGLVFVSLRLVDWKISFAQLPLLILFGLLWYHGARNIMVGQFAAIEALLIAGTLLLIMKDQDVPAGFLLALATSKPQMVIFILLLVLAWAYSSRRFSVITGFFGSFLALYLISFFFIPNWPLQMIWQIMEYPEYSDRIGSLVTILAGGLPGISSQLRTFLLIFFWGYLCLEWVLVWGKDEHWFLWTALMTLVLSQFLVTGPATTNYVIMLPAFFMILKIWKDRWGAAGKWIVWATLAVSLVGLWALFFSTVDGNLEQPAMYLPLPLFCLVGLWWVRWWAIRSHRLPSVGFVD